METAIGKAIDLVCEYTVVPLARQVKYALCYKSFISDMNKAGHELENDKKLIEKSVHAADNDLKVVSEKANEWLQEVEEAHKDVSSLINDQATRSSCIGQILNPIARHQLGRKATKKKQSIDELLLRKPKPEDLCFAPEASGLVTEAAAAAAAAQRINSGVFQSSCWNEAMNKIMKALKDDTTNIVGLYGMGGVGKSTMINEVHLQVLEQRMFDEVAKVEVKAEEDITRIQEEIASALGLTLEKTSTAIRAQLLSNRLLKTDEKKKKTVLIILDDLWEKLELGRVGIPLSNDQVQIKLLLTSRDQHLLSDKMGAWDPIPLDILGTEDALRMFRTVVGLGVEEESDKAKASKAKEIAKKCSGLPVVIMAIANALKNKVLKEWEDVLQQLDVTDALSKLEVSYEYLPCEESKRLFLICGIIRDPRIQVRDLLKYTFGLGLYERKDIYTLTAAATELEKLLAVLKAASMLLKSDDPSYVTIHDRMRDLAIRIVDRDRHEWAHFTLRDDRCEVPRRFDASKLELILSYCEEGNSQLQVPNSFFEDMKKLYVLEFSNLKGGFSLRSPTGQLHHLRKLETLCLHKCSLSDISMIGELKGLRILSFQGSDIRMIPIQLGELAALKMLDLGDCKELTQIAPNVLGNLTMLEELNMENSFKDWEIDQEDEAQPTNARLIELKNMTRLSNTRLHIPSTSMLPKDDQLFSSTLTVYKIMLGDVWSWDIGVERNESRVLMLNFDDSHSVLQQDWVQATLQRTEILYLRGSLDGICESIDELCVKGFECLKHLHVRDCPSIRYIVSSNSGSNFSVLESVSLEFLGNLEKLCNGETFSRKLKVIKVKNCNKLTHLFDFSMLKFNSSKLGEIIIENCKKMHCIVIEDEKNYDVVELLKLHSLDLQYLPNFQAFCVAEGIQPSTKALFSGKKVAFLCLESLKIRGLDELEYIWHPTDPPTEFGKLRLLDVQSCDKLVCVINSNVLTINLESLDIHRCASIKSVFDLRYKLLPGVEGFQLLKEIIISACCEMEAMIVVMLMGEEERHQQVAAIQYSSLKKLVLQYCTKLKSLCRYSSENMVGASTNTEDNIINTSEQLPVHLSLFSQKVAFPCLESLSISGLDELEYIWHPTDSSTELGKLRSLYVYSCDKLRFVINSSVLTVKLDSLTIDTCASIKHVFDLRYDQLLLGVGGIQLLKEITISNCHNMEAIVVMMMGEEEDTHQQVASIQYSSLNKLEVKECSKLKTFSCYYSYGKSDNNMVASTDYNIISTSEQQPIDSPFFSQKETFPCLDTLTLDKLKEMRQIWHQEVVAAQGSFYNLKQIAVNECPKLSSVFPSTLMIECLHMLESIEVRRCEMMQSIIVDATPLFGYGDKQDKSIPKLKFLVLGSLENFTGIWKKGQSDDGIRSNREFYIRNLESLKLDDLPKLEWNIFISQKKCTIINNDNELHPYDESILFFPSLQELDVKKCNKVKLFDSDSSTNQVQLDHHYMAIERFLISSSKKASHPPLKSLSTEYNNEYVKLRIEHDTSFGQQNQRLHLTLTNCESSSSSCMDVLSLNSPSFCNVLTRLTVESCDGLEYLLTPRGAKSLVHLTYLTIEDCNNMKEVIGVDKEEVVVDINKKRGEGQGKREDIIFNHLKEITLVMVWNLESFSSSSVNLHFPSLENLTIFGCLKMRTFCNGSVLTTPKLHQVYWSQYNNKGKSQLLKEDLNTTIQKKYATSGILSEGRRISFGEENELRVNMNALYQGMKLQKRLVEWAEMVARNIEGCRVSYVKEKRLRV